MGKSPCLLQKYYLCYCFLLWNLNESLLEKFLIEESQGRRLGGLLWKCGGGEKSQNTGKTTPKLGEYKGSEFVS